MLQDNLMFRVNLQSPIAVYVQIENQVQFAVASGRLSPGDNLPSVRELSSALEVNPNTVTKAYRDLELLGLVKTRRGVGVTITRDAPERCAETIRRTALEHLRDAVGECLASGIPAHDIEASVSEAIAEGVRPYDGSRQG